MPGCENLPMTERIQTLGEELANSVSHGVALLAAIVGTPFLIFSARELSVASLVGACVFAFTMVLLFVPVLGLQALPDSTRVLLTNALNNTRFDDLAIGAVVVLIVLDGLLLLAGLARFQRAKLILD